MRRLVVSEGQFFAADGGVVEEEGGNGQVSW